MYTTEWMEGWSENIFRNSQAVSTGWPLTNKINDSRRYDNQLKSHNGVFVAQPVVYLSFIIIICFSRMPFPDPLSRVFFSVLLKNKSQTRFFFEDRKRVPWLSLCCLASAGGAATLDCVSRWNTGASEARSWGDRSGAGGCRAAAAAEAGADG